MSEIIQNCTGKEQKYYKVSPFFLRYKIAFQSWISWHRARRYPTYLICVQFVYIQSPPNFQILRRSYRQWESFFYLTLLKADQWHIAKEKRKKKERTEGSLETNNEL